jgi:hypothetical protein
MPATITSHFDLLDLDCFDRFTHNGIEVTVVHREKIDEATGRASEMCATSDGRRAGRDWHEGAQEGQPVYYVLVTPTRIFHGWLDSKSRNVVQTG